MVQLLSALALSILCSLTVTPAAGPGLAPGDLARAAVAAAPPSRPAAPHLQQAEPPETEAGRQQRERQEREAREEAGEPHTRFVRRVLIDGVVGVENRYRRPLVGLGLHVAFLKVGNFFIGAPGVMVATAPEWAEARVLAGGDPAGAGPAREMVLKRTAALFLTQSVSWQVRAKDYGYLYVSFVATRRLPLLDSQWDPAFSISFTPR